VTTFRPSAILFDLDGLLVDSEPVWQRAEQILMSEWGAVWTHEDAVASRGTGIPETARRMGERAGRPFDEARDCALLIERFLELAPTHATEKPGARAMIERARASGIRVAVASSSPTGIVRTVLEARGLLSLFEVLVTGDDVSRKKPAPDIFLLAAERVGVAPEQCLVLEDSFPGVQAGLAAKSMVIAVPEVDRERFEGVAHAVVSDLIEAEALISFAT
jgi:HAD superfamily hydrolase (TIGR01509 family)